MDESIVARFWKYTNKRGADECWLWTGYGTPRGYGTLITRDQRHIYAHRVSYELHHGPVPAGLFVCHSCDTPSCVNPAHLWAGTAQQNTLDMLRKGRSNTPRGENCTNSKLTDQQVREILAVYSGRAGQQTELARQYGVSLSQICRIVNRKSRRSA